MGAISTRMFTFYLVSSLFLLWGFCNGMIDVMDKHFQNELNLSLSQSAWVQFAHYLGYFLMALPAGSLAQKFGYKGGIIIGLLLVSVGGFWFLAATQIETFWAFLLGVCVIASGLAILETVANPYVAVLGDAKYSAARINLAQSFNGIGWILGPIAGSMYFYNANAAQTLYIPYVGVAIGVLVIAGIFLISDVPDVVPQDEYAATGAAGDDSRSLWSRPHFVMAVAAQFLYVAAQAGIFSFFINYMTSQVPVVISDQKAAQLASFAFVCFLAGRFAGSFLLRKIPAHRMLALYGALNVLMAFVVFLKLGWLSVACVFLSYFFMSIMFPTIFALGIHGLGTRTKRAASYLVMAIIGGAILPKLMGYVADESDISRAFIVPMVCFAFVAFYGFKWPSYRHAVQRNS
jgi:FHS family L-fucose permease-like MFS transporter